MDEEQAHDVLDRCTALGITFVDTAHSYAAGAADRMIGSWLSRGRKRRSRIAVLHKVGVVVDDDGLRVDLSPTRTRAQIDDAFERLGVATIDVLAIHAPDGVTTPIATARVFIDALESGQARAWGLSNVDAATLDAWLEAADRVGLPNPRLVENEYSLLNRASAAVALAWVRDRSGVRPIIGPRRPEHLDAVEEMLSLSLTDADRELLDEVSARAT